MKSKIFLFLLTISLSISAQKTLPEVSVVDVNGKKVKLQAEINPEKVTVLSFWATWCVPCINELDAIADVYEDWQDETNVEIIAVSIDDARTQKRIKPMVNGKDWPYKILLDKNQELKRALNISVVPHVIIIKNNEILYRHTGYTPGAEDELYEKVKKHSK